MSATSQVKRAKVKKQEANTLTTTTKVKKTNVVAEVSSSSTMDMAESFILQNHINMEAIESICASQQQQQKQITACDGKHKQTPKRTKDNIETHDKNDDDNNNVDETAITNSKYNAADLTQGMLGYALLTAYFAQPGCLVQHQIESFNYFISTQLKRTVDMFSPIRVRQSLSDDAVTPYDQRHYMDAILTMSNVQLTRPQLVEANGVSRVMFPADARRRNFSYVSSLFVDVHLKYTTTTPNGHTQVVEQTLPKIHLCKQVPIMVRSMFCNLGQYSHLSPKELGECARDIGGYFILRGSEKVIIGQERTGDNLVFVYHVAKTDKKYAWSAEMKCVPDNKCISAKQVSIKMSSRPKTMNAIHVFVSRLKESIPLFIIFRAMGIYLSDLHIAKFILSCGVSTNLDKKKQTQMMTLLEASMQEAENVYTQEDAIQYISSKCLPNYYTTTTTATATATTVGTSSSQSAAVVVQMSNKRHQYITDVLHHDLYVHCRNVNQKLHLLGYMTVRLLQTALQFRQPDDRDSYLNKRVDLAGTLLNNLFRNYMNRLVKDVEKQLKREIRMGSWRTKGAFTDIVNLTNIHNIIKFTILDGGFKHAMSSGDFSMKFSGCSSKVGVAQVLNRLSPMATVSHLRRLSTPIDKNGKLCGPRKLHLSSWGIICPPETPESASVGIVKNLSILTHVTIPYDSEFVYRAIVHDDFIIMCSANDCGNNDNTTTTSQVKVWLNGCWVGYAKTPMKLYVMLKMWKRCGILPIYTSVIFDFEMLEIRVRTDSGRLTRPLLCVDEQTGQLVITKQQLQDIYSGKLQWEQLVLLTTRTTDQSSPSCIEYLDAEEQWYQLIAMNPSWLQPCHGKHKYTHCEIHPCTKFGIVAACNPFPDHNQSPRNTYQCAQAKQDMGIATTNYPLLFHKTFCVLSYPTKPLVRNRVMELANMFLTPSGSTLMVAIMVHTGYNQEDSLLVNAGSIARGMLQVMMYHTESDNDKQKSNCDDEVRCKPNVAKTSGCKLGNYNKLADNGFVPVNTFIENGDIIMGKHIQLKHARNDPSQTIKFEDASRAYKTAEDTYIDRNSFERNGDGYNSAKVRLRTFRQPVVGDKFSSRHGQKGTCGFAVPQESMPFIMGRGGICPDIILNPHAIPSRMTIGMKKEMLLGKVLVQLGICGEGTAYGGQTFEEISAALLANGFEAHGEELMQSGLTGEVMECAIFMAPCFYQRLKHMVGDKDQSRATGPTTNYMRQPTEGRQRNGGLRFGEMERDSILSHGCAEFTHDRLYTSSDAYQVHICKPCGLIAAYNDINSGTPDTCFINNVHTCNACGNCTDFSLVKIPYAFKMLIHQLMTMAVVPRMIVV